MSEPSASEKPHARLGPSSSNIWLTCLQAPAEWAKRPPKTVGRAAHEGTLAHALCEATQVIFAVPWAEGSKFMVNGTEIEVTQEMLNGVSLYARTVGLLSDIALWRAIEKQVSFAWLWKDAPADDLFGTLDFASCDGKVLYIVDFKYGLKAVNPTANTQMLCYALGALHLIEQERPDLAKTIEDIALVIIQPRAGGSPVRQWSLSIGDLIYWGQTTLKPAIEQILSGVELPLVPGNHCYWCAASFDCPAYRKLKVKRAIDSFPDWVPEQELPS